MAIVTVSRTHGSAGTIYARQTALRLGYSFYDSDALKDRDKFTKNHLCALCVQEPEAPSFLERFEELVSNRNFYKTMLFACVYDHALEDNVVFIGMGAQAILAGLPNAFHVRVVRRLSDRIRAMAQAKNISHDDALDLIRKMDHGKKEFMSHYFDKDADDATLYHLTINSSLIPLEYAVEAAGRYIEGDVTPDKTAEAAKSLSLRLLEKRAEMVLFALDMVHDYGKVVFTAGGDGILTVRGVVGGEERKKQLLKALEGLEGVRAIEDHVKVGILSHIIY
jgi:cytidylate kinase